MRYICALAGLAMTVGCHHYEEKSRCGFHFEILKPPILTAETPVLIQGGGPSLSAHPMGTLAGPVIEGRAVTAPAAPMVTQPLAMPRLGNAINGETCAPPVSSRPLTCEEWLQLQHYVERKGKTVSSSQE